MYKFQNEKNKKGIYIHIPFCYKKCNYCDFYSLPSISLAEKYTNAVCRNIRQMAEKCCDFEFDTIFIGGGTPSAIDESLIGRIINELRNSFKISNNCEISIEANPATVDSKKLTEYRAYGINRISFGMQSSVDSELKQLGRLHTFKDFVDSYELARKAGFENINIDVMTGIPCQTMKSLASTLQNVICMNPEHISAYMLKIEEGTPFYKNYSKLDLPDEDTVCDMYLMTVDVLSENGYIQYEISNFAQKDYECRHNIKYWEGTSYIGFGSAAHSYVFSERYSYPKNIKDYILCQDYDKYRTDIQFIDEDEKIRERIIFGLRLKDGIDITYLENFNYEKNVDVFIKNGYCKMENGRLSLTEKGMLVSNSIISDILLQEKN